MNGLLSAISLLPYIVGYQNKGFENQGYSIAANTFLPVGGTAEGMTLGDITPNEDFELSSIQFMTTGGATAKVSFGGKTVSAKYVYWTDEDAEDGAGWYLDADSDATVNQNDVALPMGQGFLVSRTAKETNAGFVFAGEVSSEPVTKGFSAGYNLVGNCSPANLTIGDIMPNEDFELSSIQFMTTGGATAKVSFGGKTVSAKYVYWTDEDAEDGAGWYLDADSDATVNQNDLVALDAGVGFLVSRTAKETNAMLTIPSAL